MNPPSALYGAMSRDRKPFTYTPGGLDLSEIKSERMAKRLMRNAMNQGVPEVPVQQIQSPPANPVAVPNFNCMPVQVFPTFNLPANPKSLLRTRSNPDYPREPPAQKQPQQSQLPKTKTDTSSLTYSQVNNNNSNYQRPMSMYENNSNTLSRIPQGHDFTEPILPEISYEAEYFQTVPRSYAQDKPVVMKENGSEIDNFKNYSTKLSDGAASEPVIKDKNECFIQNNTADKVTLQFNEPNDLLNINPNVNSKQSTNSRCDGNHAESNVTLNKNIDSVLNIIDNEISTRSKSVSPLFADSLIDLDFSIKPISANANTTTSIETKPFDEELKSDDEQKEVKVVKKQQVKKESKTEVQNEKQNGDAGVEAELTVKLPSKKSAAKTETKVEVVKKTLPDGSIEEIKTTTTKTTVDGKTKIAVKTETTIIPKEEEEEVEVEEEEENEEVEVQEAEENGEDEVVEQQVVEKTTKSENPSAVQNGKKESIIKKEERTETQTTKKVTVIQKQEPEEVEEEEEEEEEEEVEETKPAVSEKKVVEKEVEEVEEENEEEKEEIKQEVKEVKQQKTVSKVEVKEEQEEVEEEEEEEEEVVVKKSESKKEEVVVEAKNVEEEEVEEEEEEEKEEEVVEEVKKQEVVQTKETKEDEESEYTEEEYESEKEEEAKEQPKEQPKSEPEEPKKEPEEPKKEPEAPAKTVEKEEEKETVQEKEEKKPEPPKPSEPTIPLREPSIPLDKVEDVEIKPISLSGAPQNETFTKTVTSNTEITKTELPSSGPLSTQTEYNKYENIVTINRTTKTLDHSYEQLTQHGVPTVKTYFAPPTREPVSISPTPSKPYQPVYPPTVNQPTERRHSLLLERLSTERQMPTSDIYQNTYTNQYSNQTYEQQKQWSQEPQAEVVTVPNVKPSKITNQQWYQNKDNVIYNNVSPAPATPASQHWNQPSYLSTPQPQSLPSPQPQSQPSPQPQSQPQYIPSFTTQENTTNTYQQNNYQTYTPKPSTWGATSLNNTETLSSSVNNQQNQYSYLSNQNSTQSYQKTSQQYSSSYVPPPWEQDSSYVADTSNQTQYQTQYQPPPPSTTYTPNTSQAWNPPLPKSKFTKTPPTSYIPPAPNQSFVKPVTVEPPRVPGKKTYYSEYERRYITVPESNYVPGETKFQPQPDPSPQYYYDNNEPAENVEPQWRKELREFTEKTSQTTTETTTVQPPWEKDSEYAKTPTVPYTSTPSWSQTLRPRSWRERSFESEYVGSQETQKTSTLGRSRPLSSYGQSQIETIPERPRGVSVDRYNPNSYQGPVLGEHPPVQTHTLTVTPSAKAYHNPNVPAYHANRASAEPREQPVVYQQPRQHWGDSRASPIQSRSFKYLQWITGTDE